MFSKIGLQIPKNPPDVAEVSQELENDSTPLQNTDTQTKTPLSEVQKFLRYSPSSINFQ